MSPQSPLRMALSVGQGAELFFGDRRPGPRAEERTGPPPSPRPWTRRTRTEPGLEHRGPLGGSGAIGREGRALTVRGRVPGPPVKARATGWHLRSPVPSPRHPAPGQRARRTQAPTASRPAPPPPGRSPRSNGRSALGPFEASGTWASAWCQPGRHLCSLCHPQRPAAGPQQRYACTDAHACTPVSTASPGRPLSQSRWTPEL